MLNYYEILKPAAVGLTGTRILFIRFILILLLAVSISSCGEERVCIPGDELKVIGELIFINEGGGKVENLTAWNEGEEFASLGIGHFIWFPRSREYRFFETFPVVLNYLKQRGAAVPPWIEDMPSPELPWGTREEFYDDFDSPRMVSLREFLLDTVSLQSLFMAERLKSSLPKILNASPEDSRDHVKTQFYRVAGSPMGMYVLVDYVNFKGEGTLETESYNGEGWGLLQVLTEMKGAEPGLSALEEFAHKAEFVLVRRVNNSPPERNERRWLPGWRNRIDTYVRRGDAAVVPGRDIFCKDKFISKERIRSALKYVASKFTGKE